MHVQFAVYHISHVVYVEGVAGSTMGLEVYFVLAAVGRQVHDGRVQIRHVHGEAACIGTYHAFGHQHIASAPTCAVCILVQVFRVDADGKHRGALSSLGELVVKALVYLGVLDHVEAVGLHIVAQRLGQILPVGGVRGTLDVAGGQGVDTQEAIDIHDGRHVRNLAAILCLYIVVIDLLGIQVGGNDPCTLDLLVAHHVYGGLVFILYGVDGDVAHVVAVVLDNLKDHLADVGADSAESILQVEIFFDVEIVSLYLTRTDHVASLVVESHLETARVFLGDALRIDEVGVEDTSGEVAAHHEGGRHLVVVGVQHDVVAVVVVDHVGGAVLGDVNAETNRNIGVGCVDFAATVVHVGKGLVEFHHVVAQSVEAEQIGVGAGVFPRSFELGSQIVVGETDGGWVYGSIRRCHCCGQQ